MPDDGGRHGQAAPPGNARAQSQLGVVRVGEKVLIEPPDLVQESASIEGGAAVRPSDFLEAVVLSAVDLAGAPAAVLPVRIN